MLISRSITRLLRAMMTATQRIAAGRLDKQIVMRAGGNLAALAEAFNGMTRQLRHALAERDQVKTALRESADRYALAVRGANDGLWDWNLKTGKIYFSPRWKEILGYAEHELSNSLQTWFDRIHPDDVDAIKSAIANHLQNRTAHLQVEYRMMHKDGQYVWMLSRGIAVRDKHHAPYRMSGSQTDITMRKEAEFQLVHGAFHDALTGLPNRSLLLNRLDDVLRRSHDQNDSLFAVLFLDCDRFKVVNDSLGHNSGDALLVDLAQRLRNSLRSSDLVARLGGDEFVILLEDIHGTIDAVEVAERIQQTLRHPFCLSGHSIVITASMGIVLCDSTYTTSDEILRDADISMYKAKENGKAQHAIFNPVMHEGTLDRLKSENDLREALIRREFVLNYQPIVNLNTGELIGFEALIRWHHLEKGWINPIDFIPLAEEIGLILPIGEWVLHEACAQIYAWNTDLALNQPFTISVNLSSNQIAQPDLINQVANILSGSNLAPSQLKIEITESVIMENLDVAYYKLEALRHLGVQIYIDDFGTGYSSLGYLQKLPIDALKIDRSFVNNIGSDTGSEEIVRAIVMLAHGLGKMVIAEGIETVEQQDWLQQVGCQYAQGYLFSKPLSKDHAEMLIAKIC